MPLNHKIHSVPLVSVPQTSGCIKNLEKDSYLDQSAILLTLDILKQNRNANTFLVK